MKLQIRSPITLADPRKPDRGTSYQAQGIVKADATVMNEKGSQNTGIIRDIPIFSSRRQQLETFDKMANNDVAVDVSLRAAKVPVQGADFFIAPYGTEGEDQEIAQFVHYNLFEGQSYPFLLLMDEILRFYEYGFSVLEKCFELREWSPQRKGANRRKYTMLKKLAPRPAHTIKEFTYDDNGGPTGIVQNALRADGTREEVTIPIDKLIIFSFNKKGGNLEGKSLLRTSYKHWYYKDRLYKIDGIQKERHALGIPNIELPQNANDDDKKAAHELGRNLRTNERAYIVRPFGMNVDFAKFEGELANVMQSIEHHNGMIMLNVMVQFLLMGLHEGGGRATAGSHQNMFEKSLKFVANLICQYFNLFLIPQLVTYNFDTDKFPKLKVRNIGEARDLQVWASAIANLIKNKAITVDDDFEAWVREVVDGPDYTGKGGPREVDGPSEKKGDVETAADNAGNIGKSDDEA